MNNVLTRYRELGSNLEASVQVRREFQKQHWHRIYERCWCGFLTVPAACYEYDDKGRQTNTQGQAEAAYLASLNKTVKQPAVKPVLNTQNGACACGNAIKGRGKKCPACYQRAYRERSK